MASAMRFRHASSLAKSVSQRVAFHLTLSVSASSLRKGTNRVTFTISDGVGNTTKQTWKIIK